MRQLAADAGAVETVMFRDGWLTEASASNVLIVKDGTIVAPPKDNLILPGITYDATIGVRARGGLPLDVRPVSRAEALAADEMWLSSSTKEVLAITTVDGAAVRRRQAGSGVPPDVRRRSRRASRARRAAERVTRRRVAGVARRQRRDRRRSAPWWNTSAAPRARSHRHDLADEHDVVAGRLPRVVAAFEPRDAAVDQRRIRPAQPVARRPQSGPRAAARSAARAATWSADEHVDRVALAPLERGEDARAARAGSTAPAAASSETELNEFAVKPT